MLTDGGLSPLSVGNATFGQEVLDCIRNLAEQDHGSKTTGGFFCVVSASVPALISCLAFPLGWTM